MLSVQTITNSEYASCTYVLLSPAAPSCACIIDPGDSVGAELNAFLATHRLTPTLILLTHEHFDHIRGLQPLRERHAAPVACIAEASARLPHPQLNLSRYTPAGEVRAEPAEYALADNARLAWEDLEFHWIATPGHSPGSACIAVEGHLFTGDTLLRGHPTVTRLPGGDADALKASFRKLHALCPPETRIFPGHGEPFYLGAELAALLERDIA